MHFELLFPSKYLKASDLREKEVVLTIDPERGVKVEKLQRQGGAKEPRPVLYFLECKAAAERKGEEEKALVLNKTNAKVIAAMYGTDTDKWKGQRITLYPTRTKFGLESVECIRVRDTIPPAKEVNGAQS